MSDGKNGAEGLRADRRLADEGVKLNGLDSESILILIRTESLSFVIGRQHAGSDKPTKVQLSLGLQNISRHRMGVRSIKL
jgi:hypothetical protein